MCGCVVLGVQLACCEERFKDVVCSISTGQQHACLVHRCIDVAMTCLVKP